MTPLEADSASDPLGIIGSTIAEKYLIERFVAEGGFSLLYRAQHKIWKQPVAVKFLKALALAPPDQRQSLLDSFVQEGQLLRQLSSRTASILQAHDVGTWVSPQGEWFPYLILEWLDGKPLDAVIEEMQRARAPLTLPQILHCLEPAAKALEVVHRRGIAHRDIKPANIFVIGDPHSDDSFVKVLDFGIAKVISDMAQLSAAQAKTGTGISSFTPWYGAPEQFSKRYGATGPWTDVFAMALVMVEMLTLRSALDGDDILQLSVQSTDPASRPTPRSRGVEVSDAVERVFAKALAVQPTERYSTMGTFWNELCQAVGASQFVEVGTQSLPANELSAMGLAEARTSVLPDNRPPLSEAAKTNLGSAPTISTFAPDTVSGVGATASGPGAAPPSRAGLVIGAVAAVGLVAAAAFALRPTPPTPASSAAAPSISAPPASSVVAADGALAACPIGMVRIPGGNFYMGFDGEGATDFEKPQHSVKLSSFCIDVTEVTVEAYRACSNNGKCPRAGTTVAWPEISSHEKKVYGPLCNIDDPGRDKHPINCVDWEMAETFCKGQDKRLPTSAEWEYAVRGPDGRVYPWGDEPPDANHLNACGKECLEWGKKNGVTLEPMHKEDDSFPTTAPVGSFPKGRSRYGLDDVIGNVMEWVQDWDGPYDKAPKVDPRGPATGTERVIRGGAWNAGKSGWVRPSFRFKFAPETRSHGVGFRCAL